jgi:hypothetical protein
MNAPKKFHSLGKWLFWISVIVSGIAGGKSFQMLPTALKYHLDNSSLFFVSHRISLIFSFNVLIAVLSFLILYRYLVLQIIVIIEKRNTIEIHKPSVIRGVIYSALFLPIWFIISILLIFLEAGTGGLRDSF